MSNVIPHTSAGSRAPAFWRRVMTVVGISCKLALSMASSIARARKPGSPRAARRRAASMPAGVAALPIPSRLADRFMEIAFQAISSSKPENRGRSIRRNIRPRRATSPDAARISISPLHSVIVASSVMSSVTACVPLDRRTCAASPARPFSSDSNVDTLISATQTCAISFTSMHHHYVTFCLNSFFFFKNVIFVN